MFLAVASEPVGPLANAKYTEDVSLGAIRLIGPGRHLLTEGDSTFPLLLDAMCELTPQFKRCMLGSHSQGKSLHDLFHGCAEGVEAAP